MIASLTPFALLDYPSKLACIVWFGGCNLRCQYCYNFEFLNPCNGLEEDGVLEFLNLAKDYWMERYVAKPWIQGRIFCAKVCRR